MTGKIAREGRFGSDGFVRLMRALSAFALLLALGGGLMLTLHHHDKPTPETGPISRYPAGVVLLERFDEIGPDPFAPPAAVDLGIDVVLLPYPPASAEGFATPHRSGSAADRLLAGDLGRALVEERDARNGRLPTGAIRSVTSRVAGSSVVLSDLEDLDSDGFDDDGWFTVQAGDGSAVCVNPGWSRILPRLQGRPIDEEDGVSVAGLIWTSHGPCGSEEPFPTGQQARTGATPGTFGTSRRGEVCDVPLLLESLLAGTRPAEAWAAAQGTTVEGLAEFVDGLTPVVLLRDTLVTAVGWRDGRPATRQSVLQRGTAVLVDRHGLPVVRCLSGSPLRRPQPLPAAPFIEGRAWPGLDLEFVEVVMGGDRPVSEFVLVGVEAGEPIRRIPGAPGAAATLAGPLRSARG